MTQQPMKKITDTSLVVRSKDQTSVSMPGETVILNPHSGTYHGLDEVGTRIWSLVQEPATIQEICDTIVEEYDVEPDRCKQDLLTLLGELSTAGLVDIRDEAPR